MEELLFKRGWTRMKSGKDFYKGNLMLSIFKKGWHLVDMAKEKDKIIYEQSGKLKDKDIVQLDYINEIADI